MHFAGKANISTCGVDARSFIYLICSAQLDKSFALQTKSGLFEVIMCVLKIIG